MDLVSLIISLISGAVGGNIAGAAFKDRNSLGAIWNSVVGALGGGAGDFILKALGFFASTQATDGSIDWSNLDLTSLLASIGVGGVSGGVLTSIITLIKDALQKK